MKGGVAGTEAPETRFNRKGHYDGSDRPRTSRSSGAMFMETVDPAAFDAKFFNITPQDAISMDPQQRILLEVVYEALENAGISLESISGEKYGCYVGAHPGGRPISYRTLPCNHIDPHQITGISSHATLMRDRPT